MFRTTGNVWSAVLIILTLVSACQERSAAPAPSQRPLVNTSGISEKKRVANLDKSPMDMIYFPVDYPVLKMSGKASALPVARVIYSRPAKDGRAIFGNVVKYGQYWRLGANEGTEIEFFTDVTIMDKKVKKGRYVIYCIPYPEKWTVVLNEDLFTWGLKIHSARDVFSFDVPAIKTDQEFEVFTMEFSSANGFARLGMGWDSVKAYLPFRY